MALVPSRLRNVLFILFAAVAVGCGSSPPVPAAPPQNQSGAESKVAALTRDVRLPGAANAQEVIPDAPVVSVVGTQVRLDGEVVADTGPIVEAHRIARLDGLWTALAARRKAWKQDPAHAGATFPGEIMFAFPDDAIAAVVKSVFYTAAFAGFPNAEFLVRAPSGIGRLPVDAQVPNASASNGGLTPEQVRQVVVAHAGALRACYEIATQRDSSVGTGTLTASWKIDVRGGVQDLAIVSSDLNGEDVKGCILRQIQSWTFPASSGAPTIVSAYPFRFGATH